MKRERDPLRPVRIANCSGFYGDRASALREMIDGGDIDFVTGDYLAEVTMLVLAKNRLKDPQGGHAALFLKQIGPCLQDIADKGIRVVVNAGGLNPAGMAAAIRELCRAAGVSLSIAHVEGDDIVARLPELRAAGHALRNLDTGEPLASWGREPLTANAYLGSWGIVAALEAGADIVICPRVTDASVVVGAAAWWHAWQPGDWDRLAGGVVAGHVIECGTQATGGNFSGFQSIDDLARPGFPLAIIESDGSSTITKHAGTGGAVSIGTVTAQLLYEVQGLEYLNPDVTTRLDSIALAQTGPDHVRISGVRGGPPSPETKVAVTALGGFQNAATFVLTGLDIDAKAALVERTIRQRLDGGGISEITFRRIGAIADDPTDQLAATNLLQVTVRGEERDVGRRFFDTIVGLALANYPGLYTLKGDSRSAKSYGVYWPALIAQSALDHRAVLADGSQIPVALPPAFAPPSVTASDTSADAEDWGPTVSVPLGTICHARSGDKGGNANVGLWTEDSESARWLAGLLSTERFKELIPEARDLTVERYELPNINAVNFVVKGLLGGGATETLRLDSQAKGFSEYVRAKRVGVPARFLPA